MSLQCQKKLRRNAVTVTGTLFTSALLLFSLSLSVQTARAEWLPAKATAPATPVPAAPTPSNPTSSTESFRPAISIPVPGLVFSKLQADSATGYVDVPWLAEYVDAVYRYSIIIASTIATVMFMVGGFQYLSAGGDAARVSAGKKRITDSLVGLLLLLGSYTLLRTVNPGLVDLTALRIPLVKKKTFEVIVTTPTVPMYNGSAGIPGDPAVVAAAIAGAKKAGYDPCTILTIFAHETGLRGGPLWNGFQNGTPIEKANNFGPGQVDPLNIKPGSTAEAAAKKLYPDFPTVNSPPHEAWIARRDWLMDPERNAYIAGLLMSGRNEVLAIANYAAGPASNSAWAQANGCKPQAATIKGSLADVTAALTKACIPVPPHFPTIANPGKEHCDADKRDCSDPKPNSKAIFIGHCATSGNECVTIDTGAFVKYVLQNYQATVKAHPECAQ